MHIIHCLNIALSIQFHHIINVAMSHPVKFAYHGCCQIIHKKNCCKRKKLFQFYRVLTHSDDLIRESIGLFFNDSRLRLESTTNETAWTVQVVLLCTVQSKIGKVYLEKLIAFLLRTDANFKVLFKSSTTF